MDRGGERRRAAELILPDRRDLSPLPRPGVPVRGPPVTGRKARSNLYYRVELRDSRDGVRLCTGASQDGAQDMCACSQVMHTVWTTVMRCVELCARRRSGTARAVPSEAGSLKTKKEMFTVW